MILKKAEVAHENLLISLTMDPTISHTRKNLVKQTIIKSRGIQPWLVCLSGLSSGLQNKGH